MVWHQFNIYGIVDAIEDKYIIVNLENGDRKKFVADAEVIRRANIEVGAQVTRVNLPNIVGVVVESVPNQKHPTWRVGFPGEMIMVLEKGLRPAIIKDPIERLKMGAIGYPSDYDLKSMAADLWTRHLHNDLVSIAHARVDFKPYQIGVVHRVITEYPHRFLLCDEVGLGKTIEAAMIVKELRTRKEAHRVLILVPSGLQRQWQFELKTKFNETFAIYNRQTVAFLQNQGIESPWEHHNLIIASHTWASRKEVKKQITNLDWDIIIVDEAHHARRQRFGKKINTTNLYRLVEELVARPEHTRRSVLFLTATPMQLQYHELYSLVELLNPILFSSEQDFTRHIQELSGLNTIIDNISSGGYPDKHSEMKLLASNISDYLGLSKDQAFELIKSSDQEVVINDLKETHRLSEILIRNRRNTVGNFQPRSAFRWSVKPTQLELRILSKLDELVAEGFALAKLTNSRALGFVMTTFKKLAASSSSALLSSLIKRRDKMIEQQTSDVSIEDVEEALESDIPSAQAIDQAIDLIPNKNRLDISDLDEIINLLLKVKIDSKAEVLINELTRLFQGKPHAKVIIFTQFIETQAMIKSLLEELNWGVHIFNGRLKPIQKDQSIESFRSAKGPQILISTEAGGEGRNLQFCHIIINYDLPWNPMKVEQRIGRVDRIGQNEPVVVFNLFVEETIEERVLDVLEHRINLFKEAIGGLEPILGEIESKLHDSIRLAGEERDLYFARLAKLTEKKVRAVREAERQMADLILDDRSSGSKIFRSDHSIDELVSSKDYERFILQLLKSARTNIQQTNDPCIYEITFDPALTMEIPKIIGKQVNRLVCFDPRREINSEVIEYMGFGHPIIDYLTKSRIDGNWTHGATTIKQIKGFPSSGWHFNWLVKIGSLRPHRFVYPTFVDKNGLVRHDLSSRLLESSRTDEFEVVTCEIDYDGLDEAYNVALSDVGTLVTERSIEAQSEILPRSEEERLRIEAFHKKRSRGADDRLERVRVTLARLEQSGRSEDQAVVPMWRANLERAEAERRQVDQDRHNMLNDLEHRMQSATEYELLNVACIIV